MISELEMRELVFRELYEKSMSPDYNFIRLAEEFKERKYHYDPDIETELADQIYKLASVGCVKYHNGEYYIYDGKIYVHIVKEAVLSAFKRWLSTIGIRIAQKRKEYLFKDEYLPAIRIANKLTPRLDIIAFSNGVLDLNEYRFYDFDEKFHVLYYHPYPYEPKAKCPKWQSFLKEVLPDQAQRITLQMFLGLGLIERGTVYNEYEDCEKAKVELCLILLGGGANGKSVIYQTAMGIFGKNRISGVDYDELTSGGDEGMRARRLLRDAIFNWSSDSDARTFGRKRTGVFKRIVSGEPVTDRAIGGNVEQNYHMPYLIFNLNDLPYPEDTSLGFIRRLQFISFDVTIPAARQNRTLASELIKEYSGIFNWVLRGAKNLRARHFVFPSASGNKRQLLLAQLRADPTMSWVNAYHLRFEAFAPNESFIYIPAKDILMSIEQYCLDNDVNAPTLQSVGRTLSRMGFVKKRASGGYEYKVYGVQIEDLFKNFIIRNEDFRIYDETETSNEAYMYIDKND